MKKLSIIFSFTLFSLSLFAQTNNNLPEGAFHTSVYSLTKESPISAASLNSPITENQRITISSDGHLQAEGKRLRIFGTNLSEFPKTHELATYSAEALANQGYNCIRFHHTDADWSNCFIKKIENGKHVLNTKKLDDFDFFFAELKKQGIYSNINFLTGRTYNPSDGYKNELSNVKDWKHRHCLGFWNEEAKQHQKEYIELLMNHVNPYTGLSYKEDPAVAIVEINNENGLLHGYLSNWLEDYTGEYWQELEDKWNIWLKNNKQDYNTLSKIYNKDIKTGDFLINANSKWNFERHEGAKATLSTTNNQHTIKVEKNGTEAWHIQYNCPQLDMQAGKVYTIKFRGKASNPSKIDVSLMQAHAPWQNAGWNVKVPLTTSWQEFSYTIENSMTDNNLRLNFGSMGLSAGTTFTLADISIQEGGSISIIEPGNKSKKSVKTVKLPHHSEYSTLPKEYKNLILNFFWDLEEAYWKDMRDYVREEIGSKALIMGTAMGCSTTEIQNCFDIIDTHAYWNHPSFPVSDWDQSNYYVKNRTLTKGFNDSTLNSLAKYRVYGKPFSCSEYDHPYPNQYTSEMYPMIASFGSFQDWDCIFTFCYTLPSSKDFSKERITGYFDQGNIPSKACAAPIASRIFRNFLVKPGQQKYYIGLNTKIEKENLYKNNGWSVGNPEIYGSISVSGFHHQLGIIVEENAFTPDETFINFNSIKNEKFDSRKFFNDTKEIYYDFNTGIYLVCNDNVTISVTDKNSVLPEIPEIWKIKDRLLPLTNGSDFNSVAAVKENGNYLIYNCSWCGNLGENLHEFGKNKVYSICRDELKLTTIKNNGSGPSFVLAAEGKMDIFENKTIYLTKNSKSLWQIIPLN